MDDYRKQRILEKNRIRRRGIYLLPNLFTTAALFAGFYAIVQAMNLNFDQAAIAIFVLWPLLAEGLLGGLLVTIFDDRAVRWLPYSSGFNMLSTDPSSDYFSRTVSGLYFAAWVVALLAIGMAVNSRRDA